MTMVIKFIVCFMAGIGAGLGLSLCNEIVQLHGGTMQFESRVGNGTVVTVELKGGRV